MNIGEMWDCKYWDDMPLEPEELAKTLAIHKRHKENERVNTGETERNSSLRATDRGV